MMNKKQLLRFPVKGLITFLFFSLSAAFAQAQTVSGTVYFDANNNGVVDGVDTYLPAITVQWYKDVNGNDVADAGELQASTVTSKTGTYSFTNVSGKVIVKVESAALGDGTEARNEVIVADGFSNTSAHLYLIGQGPLCYAVEDETSGTRDDLYAINRYDGQTTLIKAGVDEDTRIEALTTNYDASLLYSIDETTFLKHDYATGNTLNGTGVTFGSITYKNAAGSNGSFALYDCDGIAIAGPNEIYVAQVYNKGVLFRIDTNGNVLNNIFGLGVQGVELSIASGVTGLPNCTQLDDIAYSPYTGQLVGILNICGNGTEYIVEIATSGTNAGKIISYKAVSLNGTKWTDIEGLGYSSTGELMGTIGDGAAIAAQDEHLLFFNNETLELEAVQKFYAAGNDFESCDCITQNSNPFVKVSISGTVFEDGDGLSDGVVDGTGSGSVDGSQLYAYLTDATGKVIRKVTVAANGTYTFDNLNTYYAYQVVISTSTVSVGDQAPATANLPGVNSASGDSYGTNNAEGTGNESGTPDMAIDVTMSTSNTTGVNFGYQSTNKITGTVWLDTDGQGDIDAGETKRAAGVTVYLYDDTDDDGNIDNGSSPIDSAVTDASGNYEFNREYTSGTESYVITINEATLPTGQQLTTDNKEVVAFTAAGQSDANNNFGYKGDPNFVEMTGTVWQDTDEGQDIDAGETVRAEDIIIRAYVDANSNGIIDANERTTYDEVLTDANGYYSLVKPYSSAVTYLLEVSERQLDGNLTTSSTQTAAFTSGGVVNEDNNFGYYADPDSLLVSGTVFFDSDENAVYGGTDGGTSGVTINMYRDENNNGVIDAGEGTVLQTTTTDGKGYYEFTKVYNCVGGTIEQRVNADVDDGREATSNGAMSLTQNQLELTDDGAFIAGIRFNGLTIPQGSEIGVAYIQFTAKANGSSDASLTITGHDTINSTGFTTTALDFTNRTKTTASVAWSPTAANWVQNRANEQEATSDISSIVKEIVDLGSWSSGNSMSFFINGPTGFLDAYTYDQSPTQAPLIHIEYESNCKDNYIFIVDETTLPSGAILTTDELEIANFTAGGQTDLGNNFGYKLLATDSIAILGTVWEDTDEDGALETGENTRASNVTVKVYEDTDKNGTLSAAERANFDLLTTDANGNYEITKAYSSAVNYIVEVQQADLDGNLTTASSLNANFTAGGQIDRANDFGYFAEEDKMLITGTVFEDKDDNNTLSTSDEGEQSVTVNLYRDINGNGIIEASDTIVTTATTDVNGYYEFDRDYLCQQGTLYNRINANSDDAREKISDGSVDDAQANIELTNGNSYIDALRFTNVTVPQGAEILNAYVQFTAAANGESDGDLTIKGFDTTDLITFAHGDAFSISTKAQTTASVSWTNPKVDWVDEDSTADERTPDISAIITEITSLSGWSSGNDLGIFITGDGKTKAYSHNTNPNKAPYLVVQYKSNCDDNYIIKIDETDLPSGALMVTDNEEGAIFTEGGQVDKNNDFGFKILESDEVAIQGTVWKDEDEGGDIDVGETVRAQNITLKVYEDTNKDGIINNNEPFVYVTTTTDENGNYTVFRPFTGAVDYIVQVDESALEGDLTTNATLVASFGVGDGGTVIQDKDFGYNPTSGKKYISGTVFNDNNQDTTFNAGDIGDAGVKVYLYDDANGNGVLDAGETTPVDSTTTDANGFYEFEQTDACQTGTYTQRTLSESDDAREKPSNGEFKTDQDLFADFTTYIYPMRFTNLTIPQGAEITSASIQFTPIANGTVDGDITIKGFDTTDLITFTHGDKYSSSTRAQTTASVSWSPLASSWIDEVASSGTTTSDISTIVKEIVDLGGWASGNDMGFMFSGTAGKIAAYDYGAGSTKAPELTISWRLNCHENFIVKLNNADLPTGYEYSTDDVEVVANLVGGGVSSIDNDFGYKFPGSVSGTIFNDKTGSGTINGTGINTASGYPLYASLVNASGDVVFTQAVANDGTYDFENVYAGTYSVVLSTTLGTVGLAPPASTLPAYWGNVGENLGATAGNDGTANGILTGITVTTGDVTNANLGIVKNKTLAIDDDNSTWVNTAVNGNVITNDFDPEQHTQTFDAFLAQDYTSSLNPLLNHTLSGFDQSGTPVATAGTLSIDGNGDYTFTPATDFVGSVTVPYKVCDNGSPSACDTAVLVIVVEEKEDPTAAGSNSIVANGDDIVSYGEQVNSVATANDADPQGDAFTVTSFKYDNNGDLTPTVSGTLGTNITIAGIDEEGNAVTNAGTFKLNANGTYIFTPLNGFVGTAKVEYEICDTVSSPYTACDKAFINITVYDDNGDANDPPFAGDDFTTTAMNVTKTGNWASNDREPNSDDIKINGATTTIDLENTSGNSGTTVISSKSTDEGGTVKFYANGTYEYTPPTDYVGADHVTYEICDVTAVEPQPLCNTATIYFIVDPIVRDYGDLSNSMYGDAWNIFKDENNDGIPEGTTPIWLGTYVTNEEGTIGGGNTAANTDIDDGLIIPTTLDTVNQNEFKVIVNSTVSNTTVYFKLYIDWDEDGTFEDIYSGNGVTGSPDTVDVAVDPPVGEDGSFNIRLRIALDSNDIEPTGGVNNGETEDYTAGITPVPVKLTYFNADKDGRRSLLTWQTASEENNDRFEIERRGEEGNWEKVDEVDGAGNSQELLDYNWTDYSPLLGVNYYRLRQVDFDGQFEYSQERAVNFAPELKVLVYPNPATSSVNVVIGDKVLSNVDVQIMDVYGKEIVNLAVTKEQYNSQGLKVNLSGLRSGYYFIRVNTGTQTDVTRLLIQN